MTKVCNMLYTATKICAILERLGKKYIRLLLFFPFLLLTGVKDYSQKFVHFPYHAWYLLHVYLTYFFYMFSVNLYHKLAFL